MWNDEINLCLDYDPGGCAMSESEYRRIEEARRENGLHTIEGVDIRDTNLDHLEALNRKYQGTKEGKVISKVYSQRLEWKREYEQAKLDLVSKMNEVGLELDKLMNWEWEFLLSQLSKLEKTLTDLSKKPRK